MQSDFKSDCIKSIYRRFHSFNCYSFGLLVYINIHIQCAKQKIDESPLVKKPRSPKQLSAVENMKATINWLETLGIHFFNAIFVVWYYSDKTNRVWKDIHIFRLPCNSYLVIGHQQIKLWFTNGQGTCNWWPVDTLWLYHDSAYE